MTRAKRIVICCDGTWNEPDEIPTNVTKIVRSILPRAADGMHQVVFYDEGVGNGGKIDKYVGGAFGSGLEKNVLDCYRFLTNNYKIGDEIYAFGFSRGAYTARAFVGMVYAVGLLEKKDLDQMRKAYKYYRTEPAKRTSNLYQHNYRPEIHMIGVFDTVGALGAPTPLLKKLTHNWVGFYDTHICDKVKYAYHALALDERRTAFQPNLWTGTLNSDQYMEQCWFAGAHSDIGGGYENAGLSDVALQWMVLKASALGLEFDNQCLSMLCKPDVHMQPHDSYSLTYKIVEPISGGRSLRRIYGDPSDPPINISIHDSVFQRIATGKYRPTNPDFPLLDALKDRRRAMRHLAMDTPPISLVGVKDPSPGQLLDFSDGGGVRIQYNGALKTGDTPGIACDRFTKNKTLCVWKKGNQYGLQFPA